MVGYLINRGCFPFRRLGDLGFLTLNLHRSEFHLGSCLIHGYGLCSRGFQLIILSLILQFPSHEAAQAWYDSEANQAVVPLRQAATTTNQLLIVDGI